MKSNSDSLPVLIALSGPLNGERWVIQDTIKIGRGKDCDIVIPDGKISRYHVQISSNSNGVILEDLNSKNGTHHNGAQLKEAVLLSDGDVIQIALAQKFTYLISDATIPLDTLVAGKQAAGSHILKLDRRSRRVWIGGKELIPALSAAQYTLLENLYRSEGRIVSREKLVQKIWGESEAYGISDQALDALVRRLRDRLASLESEQNFVITVRGHGLRLENPSD